MSRHPTVTVEEEMPIIVLLLAHALWNPQIAQRVWLVLQPEHYPNDHTRDLMALLATERVPREASLLAFVAERCPDATWVASVAALVSHAVLSAHPPKRLVEQLLEAIPPRALQHAS